MVNVCDEGIFPPGIRSCLLMLLMFIAMELISKNGV